MADEPRARRVVKPALTVRTDPTTRRDKTKLTTTQTEADHVIVGSGCSGSRKSTLVAALARHGEAVPDEPGRQIVNEGRLPPCRPRVGSSETPPGSRTWNLRSSDPGIMRPR